MPLTRVQTGSPSTRVRAGCRTALASQPPFGIRHPVMISGIHFFRLESLSKLFPEDVATPTPGSTHTDLNVVGSDESLIAFNESTC